MLRPSIPASARDALLLPVAATTPAVCAAEVGWLSYALKPRKPKCLYVKSGLSSDVVCSWSVTLIRYLTEDRTEADWLSVIATEKDAADTFPVMLTPEVEFVICGSAPCTTRNTVKDTKSINGLLRVTVKFAPRLLSPTTIFASPDELPVPTKVTLPEPFAPTNPVGAVYELLRVIVSVDVGGA